MNAKIIALCVLVAVIVVIMIAIAVMYQRNRNYSDQNDQNNQNGQNGQNGQNNQRESYSVKVRPLGGAEAQKDSRYTHVDPYLGPVSYKKPYKGWRYTEGEYKGISHTWGGTNHRDLSSQKCRATTAPDTQCGKMNEAEQFNLLHNV